MRFSAALIAAVVLLAGAWAMSPTVRAEDLPAPVPIEEWSQAKVIAMGQEIYRQDTTAWRASDALVAALGRDGVRAVRGWIVVPEGADRKVRFLNQAGDGVEVGWDVVVTGDRAGAAVVAADARLTDEELSQWTARQTALANIGRLRCSANLNTAIVRDPDGDGWLVWLLTSTTDANVVPVGGHYRFRISADGRTVQRRDQLSNGCLNQPRQPPDPGGRPVALVVSHIVSAGPVETHVFLSLQNGLPIYVATGDKLFAVQGARIRDASAALR